VWPEGLHGGMGRFCRCPGRRVGGVVAGPHRAYPSARSAACAVRGGWGGCVGDGRIRMGGRGTGGEGSMVGRGGSRTTEPGVKFSLICEVFRIPRLIEVPISISEENGTEND
jgi:hypothetical protein